MKALPAIARYMRLPEDQLRFPIELIQQGYEPNYLAMYRPDELGGIDVETLARLKRALEYETALAAHKEKVFATLQRDNQASESAQQVIDECTSVSQVDAIVRSLRTKKNAKILADEFPQVESLGQAILIYQGDPPPDMNAWVVEQSGVAPEQAEELLQQTKRWLQLLMSEDPRLLLQLQRSVLKNAVVTLTILPEPAKGEDAETEGASDSATAPTSTTETAPQPSQAITDSTTISDNSTEIEASQGGTAATDTASASESSEVTSPEHAETAPVTPLIEQFHKGRKQTKALRTKSLNEKQLSPRQRRRRWLRHILESYSRLKKPLRNLTPYQILVIARGIRSKIIELNFQQDMRGLIQSCRESLCPGRHPMHGFLLGIAEEGLKELILPKLHQDVIAILEEDAHHELIEASVLHLQNNLLQRPVGGHCILMIDAVGIKTAAISIVDAQGNVVATAEIPCNSSKPDVVSQNMSLLGQLVHQHRVTLISLSNGPARRYVMPAVVELLKQSTAGSLFWTLVDRSGCDAYTQSRTSLVELPRISRRHRAAVWLAWRLQDPLRQILKVDPARLRLGSYQRELPQAELEHALQESVSATITKAGVDVLSVDADVLKRIPGMTDQAAERVTEERQKGAITNRESLMKCLREVLSEMQARQAIGFLRVYGSDNPLDGTIIHPDDYRLAERLVAHAKFSLPPSAPEGWQKPDYEKLAAAKAAVAGMSIESVLADDSSAVVFEPKIEVNPDFGKLESDSETGTGEEPSASLAEPSEPPVESIESTPAEIEATVASDDASNADSESAASEEPSTDSVSDAAPAVEPPAASSVPVIEPSMQPMPRPELSVDVEKLARSWQVGRAKLRSVAACLQFPFADIRDFRFPVPLRSQVPSLDQLPPGSMLSALVVGVADFGVFVELGPDCSGLVHISRLASDFVEDPHMFVQIGDVIPVWVVQVDDKRKRVAVNAIPPGTEQRKRESSESQTERRDASSRPPRSGDRNERPASGQSRGNNAGRTGTQASGGRDSNRPGGTGGTGGGAGGRDQRGQRGAPSDRGRRGYGGRGNDNRERQGSVSREESAPQQKPVRIDKAQPQKPLTEAMQQGKEPLRSFSDLMQFMKQSKDEVPTASSSAGSQQPASSALPESLPPNAPQPESVPSAESNGTSVDHEGEQRLSTDANTTA